MTGFAEQVHRSVLVVEDSATMRAVCCDRLNQAGFYCDPVASAEEAWDKLKACSDDQLYSAILLDWILPTLSGEALLQRISAETRFNRVSVMIFSENPDDNAWKLVLARPNTDIQLKEELDLLPQRLLNFITSVEEKAVSLSIERLEVDAQIPSSEEVILLVDDSATVRMRYCALLREKGYAVIEADGFVEGLTLAKQRKPSLAILDFYMPDGNGDLLCKELLKQDAADAVVMFSQRKDVTEIALEVGALDLLFKDDSAHLFLMRISAIMQVIRSQRSSRQLDLLVWSTQALGFGIMRPSPAGLVAENAVMEQYQMDAGGLEVFDTQATFNNPLELTYLSGEIHYFVVHRYSCGNNEEVVVAQDITLQKVAEKEIHDAKEAAENANEAKTKFLSNMSHELKTPLNAIIVLSRMLWEKKNDNMTARQIESAGIIHRSGNDLLLLINDILDIGKIEAGMIDIEIRRFDLQECLGKLKAQLDPLTFNKQYSIQWEFGETLPELVQTDEMRLSQVIRNLVSNAVKFTQKGSVSVSVDLLNPNTVGIRVADTGIGVKSENLSKIFGEFQQEDISTSRHFGGTGLGLSICKSLMELMGGHIKMESELGKGSTFTIEFPVDLVVDDSSDLKISAPPQKEGSKTEKVQPTETTELRNKTILLVDDDEGNIYSLKESLDEFDINFIVAENGQQALAHLTENVTPDLVLIDLMMPVMNGYVAIEKIRQQSRWQHLPIIALTANTENKEEEKCRAIGADDFLSKPVDLERLIEKMSLALQPQNGEARHD